MKCFGHYISGDTSRGCKDCEYLTACQIYTETEGRMEQRSYNQSYDEIAEYAIDIADTEHAPDLLAIENDTVSETEDSNEALKLADILHFILYLDDYDLGIVREIIAPSTTKNLSVAELARMRNISRQAMHRKILDLARKNPMLRDLLTCVLLKLKKNRQLFENSPTKESLEKKKSRTQLEFSF